MIAIIIFVALVIIAFELILTFKVKIFKKINEHSWIAGIALSLLLGQVVGLMFGLGGAIVGMASVLAMVCTDSIYALKRKFVKSSSSARNELSSWVTDFKKTWGWFFKLTKYTILIATSPIWIPVVIRRKLVGPSQPAKA